MKKTDQSSGWGFSIPAGLAAAASTTFQLSPDIEGAKMTQHETFTAREGPATNTAMPFDDRLFDAKLKILEVQTDNKFSQLLGELRVIGERIGTLDTRLSGLDTRVGDLKTDIGTVDTHARAAKSTIITTVIGTGIAVAALAWAGVQIFQGGLGLSSSAFQAGMDAKVTNQPAVTADN